MKRFSILSSITVFSVSLAYFLPYGFWAELNGLPAHPLIVHAVVVLLPLISLFILLTLVKRELLMSSHLYLIGALGLTTLGVIAAKSSGDSLSAAVGLPAFHAEWGNNLVPLAMALTIGFISFTFFAIYWPKRSLSKTISVLLVGLSLGSVAMTYVVGHSGAESVWKEEYTNSKKSIVESPLEFTYEQVAKHNSVDDCWTIVNNNVYDVTSFANRHPAGSSAIEDMCGKDANEDFLSEHAGQAEPLFWLETLKIGVLKQ